jgi:hypothetical protein
LLTAVTVTVSGLLALGLGVGDSDESRNRDYVDISLILVLWCLSAEYYCYVTLITLIVGLLAGGYFCTGVI